MNRISFRFHAWVIAFTLALSATLLSVFLYVVLSKASVITEKNAQARFGENARAAAGELESLIKASGLFVRSLARSSAGTFITSQGEPALTLLPVFLSELAGGTESYSHFFALPNGDFVQAIGVRGNERIARSLDAPANTYFATRIITRRAAGQRIEQWQFLSRERALLGSRSQPATFDPRQRPWYSSAMASEGLTLPPPYIYASSNELGLTLSESLADQRGVMGSDIVLSSITTVLGSLPLTPEGAVFMLDATRHILAFHGNGERHRGLAIKPLMPLADVSQPAARLFSGSGTWEASGKVHATIAEVGDDKLILAVYPFELIKGQVYEIAALAPLSDFNGPSRAARKELLWTLGGILLLLVPLVAWASRRMSRQLKRLTQQANDITQMRFGGEDIALRTRVQELNTLVHAQNVMRQAIQRRTQELARERDKLDRLVRTGLDLAREQDRSALLHAVLFGGRDMAPCQAATLFLKTPQNTLRFTQRTLDDALPSFELPLFDPKTGQPNDHFMAVHAAIHRQPVIIDDVYAETRFDMSGTKKFSEESGLRTISLLTLPLSPREGEVIGVLQFVNALDANTGAVTTFDHSVVSYLQALATQAAVALENQNLLAAQKVLMDSLVKLIAGAIDAKSAYTGGHCERVPELAAMLVAEATQVKEGPLANFGFHTEDEWREFHIGSWLHDCGKVTTPEYVVDKATKLETIYNRIHEVRMRFEVLRRDADIDRLKSIAGGVHPAVAQDAFDGRCAQLEADFAFVAECNLGGEFMSPEHMQRIRDVGNQTWLRHFDDRLGLSHEELRRYEAEPEALLPAVEHLLADKPTHVLARHAAKGFDAKYGIQVAVPEHLYNFGEVYNLCISRGTLSPEERYKINEHVIQTLVMLDQLPWPDHLKRVPEYAATHHETLIGTGYPRKLGAADLSIPARIMAIADIFEALTASDRPYKKAKTLSESIKILSFFKKDKHIDGPLFDLFLTSGVYLKYAQKYLLPEQIDPVDIGKYVSVPPSA